MTIYHISPAGHRTVWPKQHLGGSGVRGTFLEDMIPELTFEKFSYRVRRWGDYCYNVPGTLWLELVCGPHEIIAFVV